MKRVPSFSDYEAVAVELQRIAEIVRHRPEFNGQTAERLDAIARDILSDLQCSRSKAGPKVTNE